MTSLTGQHHLHARLEGRFLPKPGARFELEILPELTHLFEAEPADEREQSHPANWLPQMTWPASKSCDKARYTP